MASDLDDKLNYCKLLGNQYAKLGVLTDDELVSQGEMLHGHSKSGKARVAQARQVARQMLLQAWEMTGKDAGKILEFLKDAPQIIARDILKIKVLQQPDFELLRLQESLRFVIAGFVDRRSNTIGVVNTYSCECQRFTLAHEIGHWLLHPEEVKFRDAPIMALDSVSLTRDPSEREANAFAAELLMPQKTVKAEFMRTFGRVLSLSRDEGIIIELATLSRISSPNPKQFDQLDVNSKASLIAQISIIKGRPFLSLSERFDVSSLALGIRLKELRLIVE